MSQFRFVATTLFGLEDVLADELNDLGADGIRKLNRAVEFKGSLAMMYKANLCLRTALRVLMSVKFFRVRDEEHLYNEVLKINWEDYFDRSHSFAVTPVVNSPKFKHSKFIAQKVKDAIADQFRKATGSRPTVDLKNPSVIVNIHIDNELVHVSLDSSGEPLFKRGYRTENHETSINEVLAAGMIKISGWKGDSSFIDPMCGSGTIAIEAAMISAGIFPGAVRKEYSFFNWKYFDNRLFELIKNQLSGPVPPEYKIYASDISQESVEKARINIRNAGLHEYIELSRCEIRNLIPNDNGGVIITNPPYGQRLQLPEICALYKEWGDVMKSRFNGYDAWVISPDMDALKCIGLKPDRKIWLVNGNLKCRFNRYMLYKGSKKQSKNITDATIE